MAILYPPELKTVSVDMLRVGMRVHDLNVDWFSHSFWRNSFVIESQKTISRIRHGHVREVVIDVANGLDIDPRVKAAIDAKAAERLDEVSQRYLSLIQERSKKLLSSISFAEECRRVRFIRNESSEVVRDILQKVRLGREIDLQQAESVIERIMGSVLRHPDALIPLLRLKEHNAYTFQHSVSVAALSIALGNTLGFEGDRLRQLALGALLHDIGKACIPDAILNKPSRLTQLEMDCMHTHVQESKRIASNIAGISSLSLECIACHHEKVDGSGYPLGLAGDEIPLHAQVVAIADAYDAMTSGRVYQRRIEPTEALRRLFATAENHYAEGVIKGLIRTLGVYPAGSLVRLANGYLAVVLETSKLGLIKPKLLVMFDTKSNQYIPAFELNLALRPNFPPIVDFESYSRWGIDPAAWQPH